MRATKGGSVRKMLIQNCIRSVSRIRVYAGFVHKVAGAWQEMLRAVRCRGTLFGKEPAVLDRALVEGLREDLREKVPQSALGLLDRGELELFLNGALQVFDPAYGNEWLATGSLDAVGIGFDHDAFG